jgi:hypothetical protein
MEMDPSNLESFSAAIFLKENKRIKILIKEI